MYISYIIASANISVQVYSFSLFLFFLTDPSGSNEVVPCDEGCHLFLSKQRFLFSTPTVRSSCSASVMPLLLFVHIIC